MEFKNYGGMSKHIIEDGWIEIGPFIVSHCAGEYVVAQSDNHPEMSFDTQIKAERECYRRLAEALGEDIKLHDFWDFARCSNSVKRDSPGNRKYRLEYRGLRKVRRWKDPRTGEKRVTVEIELEV